LRQFEDVLYGACLIDWDAERERMHRYLERFDNAREVRLVGTGTDLRLSLDGRTGEIDAGLVNMPGGELVLSPVEEAGGGRSALGGRSAAPSSRRSTRGTSSPACSSSSGMGVLSTRQQPGARSTCWRSSIETTAHAGSASSASAATPASSATCATRSSTRR